MGATVSLVNAVVNIVRRSAAAILLAAPARMPFLAVGITLISVVGTPLTQSANASPEALVAGDSATVVSEPGETIAGGHNWLFDTPGAVVVRGGAHHVEVEAEYEGERFGFDFAPPAGKQLEVGEYARAEGYPFEVKTLPGVHLSHNDVGCGDDFGRFIIKDISFDASGNVERLWLLYEEHCGTPEAPALFGELRVDEPLSTAPETVAPAAVDWPRTLVGGASVNVPVTVTAGESAAQVASATLEGEDAEDFRVRSDGCMGAALAPGASCQLMVAATPKDPGERVAQLVLTDVSGESTTVALAVDTEPLPEPPMTANSATLVSEPGAFVGGGVDELFDAPEAVTMRGEKHHVEVNAEYSNGRFSFDFAAPAGKQLEVGEYLRAERYPFEAKGSPGLDVSGDGEGCNQDFGRFVIKDIAFNASGTVERFWALYEQHCERPESAALFGEVRVGEPPVETPYVVQPAAIEWPQTEVGVTGTAVPVTIGGGTSGAKIASVAVDGKDPADFGVTHDGCTGANLAADSRCEIAVNVTPITLGRREAQLVVTDESGAATTVPLSVDTEPPPPPPIGANSATLVSDGEFIGHGEDWLFNAPDDVTATGERGYVHVEAEYGGNRFDFEFAAPGGGSLRAREYRDAEGFFGKKHHPFLSVSGDGSGCSEDFGRFIVKDIKLGSGGGVERFWALYEQHCDGPRGAVSFGEVRVGEPSTNAPELVQPADVEWPPTTVDTSGADVPITVSAGEAGARISSVAMRGRQAPDFSLNADGCTGATLPANGYCKVLVDVKPKAAGHRTAQLVVTDQSGAKTVINLSVHAAHQ